jgi:hypothetical protein
LVRTTQTSGWFPHRRERALGDFKVSGIPRLVILGPDGRELVNNAVGMSLSIATVDGWMRQAKGHK